MLRTTTGRPNVRLDLTLARVARTLAERRAAPQVEREDVARAAVLVGLVRPASPSPAPAIGETTPSEPPAGAGFEELSEPDSPIVPAVAGDEADEEALLLEQPTEGTVGRPAVLGPADPLRPEDDPESLPEPRSLQWAASGRARSGRAEGVVIGHERSTGLEDLAVVPTLFRAMLRTRPASADRATGRLLIAREDLRRYRRRRGAERVLVLVLDHTARRGWDCGPGLAPHLRWAYDRLATVSMIEFGHRDCAHELRPERYRARTIADRRILASLTRTPGSASPLAAAIGLAAEELRRTMHRGWATVRAARLVLVTDGRGNVPLEATAERRVTGRVGREGVDDALAVARTVAGLQRVETVVVAPVDEQYPTLTQDLATALSGTVTLVHGDAR